MSSTTLDYQNDQAIKRICVVNRLQKVILSDSEILNVLKQIQGQLKNEFMKYHGFTAKLYYCPKKVQEPINMWNMYLLDTADGAGYLGYHDANDNGIPQGKVFVQTAQNSGAQWSVTLSHEILEALCDPWGMDNFFSDSGSRKRLVAWEVCDPVEADKYSYKKNGISVTNFITPYWKHPFNDTGELDNKISYDLLNKLSKSFQTLRGCHQSYYYISGGPNGQQGWTEKTFQTETEHEFELHPISNIHANFLDTLNLKQLDDDKSIKIYSPSVIGTNWHIGFKLPNDSMVSEFDITKDEIEEAIHSAFVYTPGSRRDIRFKMSIAGFKGLFKNENQSKLSELNNITQSVSNIYAVDKSFE